MPDLLKPVGWALRVHCAGRDDLSRSPLHPFSRFPTSPAQHLLALAAILDGHIDRQHALIGAVRIHDPNGPFAAADRSERRWIDHPDSRSVTHSEAAWARAW